jgi:hypothetical protein
MPFRASACKPCETWNFPRSLVFLRPRWIGPRSCSVYAGVRIHFIKGAVAKVAVEDPSREPATPMDSPLVADGIVQRINGHGDNEHGRGASFTIARPPKNFVAVPRMQLQRKLVPNDIELSETINRARQDERNLHGALTWNQLRAILQGALHKRERAPLPFVCRWRRRLVCDPCQASGSGFCGLCRGRLGSAEMPENALTEFAACPRQWTTRP